MLFRLAALIGLVAHSIDRLGNWVIGLTGLRVRLPFAAILSIPLLWACVTSTGAAIARLNERAEPRPATVADLVERIGDPTAYYALTGLAASESLVVEVPVFDPDGLMAGVRTDAYYLLRDADDPDAAVVVRSPLTDDLFRRRTVNATVVEDPAFIADGLERLGAAASEWEVDRTVYLDETDAGAAPTGGSRPLASALTDAVGGEAVAADGAVVSPGQLAACDVGVGEVCMGAPVTLYLFGDAATRDAVLLRSSASLDAVPTRVTGLLLAPTTDAEQVLASDWLADERASLRMPPRRILFDGLEPPFFAPSFVGPILSGGLAALLLASTVIGYPLFRRERRAVASYAAAPTATLDDESIDGVRVAISGRLPTPRGRLHLADEIGRIRRLAPLDYELTRWRYGDAPPGVSARELAASREAGGGEPHLVIDVTNQSVLVRLRPREGPPLTLVPGTVVYVRRRVPALRARDGAGTDLTLGFASDSERAHFAGVVGHSADAEQPPPGAVRATDR